jgi:hypothetical protein
MVVPDLSVTSAIPLMGLTGLNGPMTRTSFSLCPSATMPHQWISILTPVFGPAVAANRDTGTIFRQGAG